MKTEVDLLLLSRDPSPPRADVRGGIEAQAQAGNGLRIRVHRVFGPPCPDDPNRWETIARARNAAKRHGSAPWVLCLDDDVVLGPGCVARLVEGLAARPGFAALAADSAGEMRRGWQSWDYPAHVGMAAALFRRERLAALTFRWEPGRCECLCCGDDLRRAGFGIGYLPGAIAWHRPIPRPAAEAEAEAEAEASPAAAAETAPAPALPGRILAAFNRRDQRRFRCQFLPTLRACGNREPVTAFTYGLYPSERAMLAREPGVEVVAIADNGVCPALRRLRDFQAVVGRWPGDTPVAYWDAGDIQFQGALGPLWETVRAHPDALLAVREPLSTYPENPVIRTWSNFIIDPSARRAAFRLMSTHTFLNSGFAAGTARALMAYLREGDRLLNSTALRGVGDWGDQPAMNLYCHTHPGAWREVSSGWNFCLAGRPRREFRLRPDGRTERTDGEPVPVVHGNAATLGVRALAFMA